MLRFLNIHSKLFVFNFITTCFYKEWSSQTILGNLFYVINLFDKIVIVGGDVFLHRNVTKSKSFINYEIWLFDSLLSILLYGNVLHQVSSNSCQKMHWLNYWFREFRVCIHNSGINTRTKILCASLHKGK